MLRVKIICSTEDEYSRNSTVMKQKPFERKYNEDNLIRQTYKTDLIGQKQLLQDNENINSKKSIRLVLKYNRRFQTYQKL